MKSKVTTLKEWREANRYSQVAFAKLLKDKCAIEKVDRTNVWHWENGTKPRKAMLEAIQKATGGKVRPSSFSVSP